MSQSNGYVTTNSYNGRSLRMYWKRTSYSTSNNTSTIHWELRGAGSASQYYYARKFRAKINGDVVYDTDKDVQLKENTLVAEGNKTIHHNSDGSGEIRIYIECAIYGYDVNCKSPVDPVYSHSLPRIPRSSTIHTASGYIESTIDIDIDRHSKEFVHTLEYSVGSDVHGTIASKTSKTRVSWTIPNTLYKKVPADSTRVTVKITCYTYPNENSSSYIGTPDTFTIYAKTSGSKCAPTIPSYSINNRSGTSKHTGDNTTFIKGFSSAVVTVSANAHNYANIDSIKVVKGKTYKISRSGEAVTIPEITSGTFKIVVTDTRGYTTSKTVTRDVVPYEPLTCNYKVNIAADGSGSLRIYGNCYRGKFGSNTNAHTNVLNLGYKYFRVGDSDPGFTKVSQIDWVGNKYSCDISFPVGTFDYQGRYVFDVSASDLLNKKDLKKRTISGMPLFDWGEKDFNFNIPVGVSPSALSQTLSNLGLKPIPKTVGLLNAPPTYSVFTGHNYVCEYIPAFKICLFKGYVQTHKSKSFKNGDMYRAFKIPEEIKPRTTAPLGVSSSPRVSVRAVDSTTSERSIEVKFRENVNSARDTSYDIYMQGYWFV